MNWQDEGFLLSKIKFRENANIVNVFTNKRGKVSGIIYGGSSRKIRNFLQIANKIFIIYSFAISNIYYMPAKDKDNYKRSSDAKDGNELEM